MNVTGQAATGTFGSTAVLFGAGNFTGRLLADDRGTVRLNGAVQRLTMRYFFTTTYRATYFTTS